MHTYGFTGWGGHGCGECLVWAPHTHVGCLHIFDNKQSCVPGSRCGWESMYIDWLYVVVLTATGVYTHYASCHPSRVISVALNQLTSYVASYDGNESRTTDTNEQMIGMNK